MTTKTYIAFCSGYRYQGTLIKEDDLSFYILDFKSNAEVRLPKTSTILQEVRE